MKLYSLRIEGFRKHYNTEVLFDDATFLIGENNIGKSSILAAVKYLLSDIKTIDEKEFFAQRDTEGNTERISKEIILTAEFRNLPREALKWRGFKGRVLKYEPEENDTGLKIIYRKTFKLGDKCQIQMLEYARELKEQYKECKTLNDIILQGINEEDLVEPFRGTSRDKILTSTDKKKYIFLEDMYDIDEEEEKWIENPGGISSIVLSKLPRFLLIPAEDKANELDGNNGTLVKTLEEIFREVRERSEHYKKAQEYLNLLATELNPEDADSDLGIMMNELNQVLGDVFPNTGINAMASLSEADTVIKPQFKVSMYSNIDTDVSLQGTGMIRASVFALLRYKSERDLKSVNEGEYIRPVIIGFEEPEIYLHPNAAMQMRETIYNLAATKVNQIVCTTHSPYMIDLSKRPKQILNNLSEASSDIIVEDGVKNVNYIRANPFNIGAAFKQLAADQRQYIKMLVKIDDEVSKIFFADKVLIVEGDTEEVVIREAIERMPERVRKEVISKWQIVKARGKATIISLIKYLKAMGINPVVIHDKDEGKAGAEVFNAPIAEAIGDRADLHVVENCIEDLLGYDAPSYDKPFKAYKYTQETWGEEWSTVSVGIKKLLERVFKEEFEIYQVCETEEQVAVLGE